MKLPVSTKRATVI